MVSLEVRPGGPLVFVVNVEGHGPVTVTSRRPSIFNSRETNRTALRTALRLAEQFADEHKGELARSYEIIMQPNAA